MECHIWVKTRVKFKKRMIWTRIYTFETGRVQLTRSWTNNRLHVLQKYRGRKVQTRHQKWQSGGRVADWIATLIVRNWRHVNLLSKWSTFSFLFFEKRGTGIGKFGMWMRPRGLAGGACRRWNRGIRIPRVRSWIPNINKIKPNKQKEEGKAR